MFDIDSIFTFFEYTKKCRNLNNSFKFLHFKGIDSVLSILLHQIIHKMLDAVNALVDLLH